MNEIEIYTTGEGVRLEIRFEGDTVWATQKQIAELFKTTPAKYHSSLEKSIF